MATDQDHLLPRVGWLGRLRGAWHALSGPPGLTAGTGGTLPATTRAAAPAQVLLIESLIGGLPQPAIVLDRDGRAPSGASSGQTSLPWLEAKELSRWMYPGK